MKKLLALMLSVVMIFACVSISVCAENESNTDVNFELSMMTGAQIRLGDKNGLRFFTVLSDDDQAKITSLREAGYTVEMGTLIAPADIIPSDDSTITTYTANDSLARTGDLTFDTPQAGRILSHSSNVVQVYKVYVDVPFTASNYYQIGETSGIAGSIVNIKESGTYYCQNTGNITRSFVARGYIKVTDTEGNVTYSYASYSNSTVANNTRSLKTVATALQSDTTQTELYQNYKTYVDKWANSNRDFWSRPY